MPTDNERLVVILGQTDFSAGLADRINASRTAIEESAIAVALVAQNDGQLGQAERYFIAHPDSRVTVLHARAYPNDCQRTIQRLRELGQRIVFVTSLHNGHAQKTAEALAHELDVDQVVIETSGNLHRCTLSAITRLLGLRVNPDHVEIYEDPATGHIPPRTSIVRRHSSTKARPSVKRPERIPVCHQTHALPLEWTGPAAQRPPTVSTDVPPPALHETKKTEGYSVKAAIPSNPQPPTEAFNANVSTLAHRTRKELSMSMSTDSTPQPGDDLIFPIENVIKKLESLVRDDLAQIRVCFERLQATSRWFSDLEQTCIAAREHIDAELANLPTSIASDAPSAAADSTIMPPPVNPSAHRTHHHRASKSCTYSLGHGRAVTLTGTKAIQLFAALLERNQNGGMPLSPDELGPILNLDSRQGVHQAVYSLRTQLKAQLGDAIVEECLLFRNGKGYRWDDTPLAQ